MNSGTAVFAQLIQHLSHHEFQECVRRYDGEHKVKSFSCWDEFLTMAFAQRTFREGLGDIEAWLRATQDRLYHRRIRGQVSRNTLCNANEAWGANRRSPAGKGGSVRGASGAVARAAGGEKRTRAACRRQTPRVSRRRNLLLWRRMEQVFPRVK